MVGNVRNLEVVIHGIMVIVGHVLFSGSEIYIS